MFQLCAAAHIPPEHNHDWLHKLLLCTWDAGAPADSKDAFKGCLDKVGRRASGGGRG